MRQMLIGAGALACLLFAGFLFWSLRGQAPDLPPPPPPEPPRAAALPTAAAPAVKGSPPPEPPAAKKATREEARFNRYDRDRDETITRIEMMSSRTNDFRKLDANGDNLLSFEEWAAATAKRFEGADGDRNGRLTRAEFAFTRPKRQAPRCKC